MARGRRHNVERPRNVNTPERAACHVRGRCQPPGDELLGRPGPAAHKKAPQPREQEQFVICNKAKLSSSDSPCKMCAFESDSQVSSVYGKLQTEATACWSFPAAAAQP